MIAQLEKSLRSFEGPLTEELVRSPGQFGLGQVPKNLKPDATTTSICGYCSTGCSLKIHLKDGQGVNISPENSYPVNKGMACPKGWEALTPLNSPNRATTPLYRNIREGIFQKTDWAEASQIFCDRMRAVQEEHGKESIAFISTGQICSEEMALLGAFSKFGMGMIHGDGNTRQCMATSVVAYKQSFGFDAPPYTYKDFEESDVICLIGSNLCVAHPIMWQRVLQNPNSPKILVFDPRKTETAMQATQHVPLAPKSDLPLFYGIANRLIEKEYIDRNYIDQSTSGFEEFAEFVKAYPIETTSRLTGLEVTEIDQVVESIGQGKRVSFWWTMGVNQGHESTRTAQAIINLALMSGNIGRPGTGANSITGQCNAMGSRIFSNTTALFGGRDYTIESDRKFISDTLGIEKECIQNKPGWSYDQIVENIDKGKIKALWVIATNGSHSWINQSRFRKLLDKLDFLVVQDMYANTETAVQADLVLPAAGWGEKEGTFINSERRIGHIKRVSQAPGMALSDFNILRLLAKAWGCGEWIDRWSSPEAAFKILRECSKGQPCDFTGIEDYDALDKAGGIQWPHNNESHKQQERRLFCDGVFYTNSGKANFIYEKPKDYPDKIDVDYPTILLTGRGSSGQWHTDTRTGQSKILRKLNPKSNYIEINKIDAHQMGIITGETVKVESRNGDCNIRCLISNNVLPGQAFMPMHFEETNRLTSDVFDTYSRQPSYKYTAIKVSKR